MIWRWEQIKQHSLGGVESCKIIVLESKRKCRPKIQVEEWLSLILNGKGVRECRRSIAMLIDFQVYVEWFFPSLPTFPVMCLAILFTENVEAWVRMVWEEKTKCETSQKGKQQNCKRTGRVLREPRMNETGKENRSPVTCVINLHRHACLFMQRSADEEQVSQSGFSAAQSTTQDVLIARNRTSFSS